MRRFSLFLLLASVAAPAVAADQDDRGGRHHRGQQSEQSESRGERPGRAERAESRRSEAGEQRAFGAQRSERSQANEQGTTERIREHVRAQQEARQVSGAAQPQGDGSARPWRRTQSQQATGQGQSSWRERERQVRTIPDTRPGTTTQGSGTLARQFESRHRRDYRNGNYQRWSSTHWRNDRRYDWRNYRERNRSIFRLGFYYDPFGWNYRRWSIGSYLHSSYYGSNFWLDDPWRYRLPPAYGPYRWVRYWDDALLVNIYTGEVVDVMHNFFW